MTEKEGAAASNGALAAIHENTQEMLGRIIVLTSAMSALVRSHPDPAGFAAEMRRTWAKDAPANVAPEAEHALLAGIDAGLSELESASRVPLRLRLTGSIFSPE